MYYGQIRPGDNTHSVVFWTAYSKLQWSMLSFYQKLTNFQQQFEVLCMGYEFATVGWYNDDDAVKL